MSPLRRWLAPVLLLGAIGVLLALQLGAGEETAPASRGIPAPAGPPPDLTLGVTVRPLAANASVRWEPSDLAEVDRFERAAGQHAGIVMWFADWTHDFDPEQARAVASRGSIPEVSWEPWNAREGIVQPQYRLARIAAGDFDAYVRRWARGAAAYGGPLRVRFAHEMNGRWYPWAEQINGNRNRGFIRAWRHVHDIFTAEGADNVAWIWAPVTGRIDRHYYPGDRYVDVVGVSGFNGGTLLFRRTWRSFVTAFRGSIRALQKVAPGKPLELTEIASTEEGGSKAAWIRGMFAEIRRTPAITSLVWFDVRKEADWRITSSAASRAAFARGMARLRAAGR